MNKPRSPRKPRKENIGLVRYMDALGRLVIPKEFRVTMGISTGTGMEMFLVKRGGSMEVVIKKYQTDDE